MENNTIEQLVSPENKQNFWGMEERTRYFVWLLTILSIASAICFAILLDQHAHIPKETETVHSNPFKDLSLSAKGVIVWDVVNKQELFSKSPDTSLPLASLTKVMTAVTLIRKFPHASSVHIAEDYLAPEGDSGLIVGDTWTQSDLTDFTLLTSSNDGARALAAVAYADSQGSDNFIEAMNEVAGELGLSNSRFFNEHGLDREAQHGGAYGSARDMAELFAYTLHSYPHLLEATRYKNLAIASSHQIYNAHNTNSFVDNIPGLLASKTGYTELAGGNLVIAFDPGLNRPIVISILGSTQEGRFVDALELVDATMKYITDN